MTPTIQYVFERTQAAFCVPVLFRGGLVIACSTLLTLQEAVPLVLFSVEVLTRRAFTTIIHSLSHAIIMSHAIIISHAIIMSHLRRI